MLKITDFLTFTPHVCFGLFLQVHPGFQIFVKSLTRQLAMEAMVQAKNEVLMMKKLRNKNAEGGRIQKLWII